YGHRSDIRGLSVSSSNNAIVSGGGNEPDDMEHTFLRPVASLQNEAMLDVTAVVFTQGDGHVVAATKTGELFLWDVAGCELLESRKGHEGTIWRVMHSPDGKQLLSVSSDKRAKFWAYEVVAEGT
ncbi:WD domain, G-beta repeat protein, partial [Ostertagia ostertagi]